jgi:hypothetical protein
MFFVLKKAMFDAPEVDGVIGVEPVLVTVLLPS